MRSVLNRAELFPVRVKIKPLIFREDAAGSHIRLRHQRAVRVGEHGNAQDGEHLPLLLGGDAHRLARAIQPPAGVRELTRDLAGALLGRELRAELVGAALG